MKLAGMAWRTLAADVAVGRRKFRVVRPTRPPKHAPLYIGYPVPQMLVDKPSAVDLAAAWWLAAPPFGSSDKNRRNAWGVIHVEYCADRR